MKTPKSSTPAAKSKLNTPRSGFIQKSSSTSKKVKLAAAINSDMTKNNGTPTSAFNFKKGKKSYSPPFNKNKQETNKKIDSSMEVTNESNLVQSPKVNNASPKHNKSPTINKGIEKINVNKEPKENSPMKKKLENDNSELPNNKRLKNFNKKQNKKNKQQNDASPEVQLGLDIEQFLKNSSPKEASNESKANRKKKNQQKKIAKTLDDKVQKPKPMDPNDALVEFVTIKNAVSALKKYVDASPEEKKDVIGLGIKPYFLQTCFIKEPTTLRSRILLPHSILHKNPDICLFVSDKGKINDADDIIDKTKELLNRCGVNCVTEILPWKKALREHSQLEQKKKLMNRFDLFLIEDKLARIKAGLTDRFPARKWPIAVSLKPESRVKKSIDAALKKIPLPFKAKGLTSSLTFGHHDMTVEQLAENLQSVIQSLCDESIISLGRENIRSLTIKTEKSTSFPVYLSKKSSNLVKTSPKPQKPKDEGVEGELSTQPGKIVKVFKDGRVTLKKMKENKIQEKNKKIEVFKKKIVNDDDEEEDDDDGEEEEDDDEEEDISDDDDEMEESKSNQKLKKNMKGNIVSETFSEEEEDDDEEDEDDDDEDEDSVGIKSKLNKKKLKKKNESSSDDDDQIDEAETNFLKELRTQQDEIESKGQSQRVQKGAQNNKKSFDKAVQNKKNAKHMKGNIQSAAANKKPGWPKNVNKNFKKMNQGESTSNDSNKQKQGFKRKNFSPNRYFSPNNQNNKNQLFNKVAKSK